MKYVLPIIISAILILTAYLYSSSNDHPLMILNLGLFLMVYAKMDFILENIRNLKS